MATEDKAKDIESIAAKSVATESTIEASKVSLRVLKLTSLLHSSDTIPYIMDIVVAVNFHRFISGQKVCRIAKF